MRSDFALAASGCKRERGCKITGIGQTAGVGRKEPTADLPISPAWAQVVTPKTREPYKLFRAFIVLVLTACPAFSDIEGESDHKFQNAVELWLEGEDLAAIVALRNLAYMDNTAAQIFLGRISDFRYTHEIYAKLDKKELLDLTTAQGNDVGRFGKSWLEVASSKEPLARAFRDAMRPDAFWETIPVLSNMAKAVL